MRQSLPHRGISKVNNSCTSFAVRVISSVFYTVRASVLVLIIVRFKMDDKNKRISKSKVKGGAEKQREKKRRKMLEEAKGCRSLENMFASVNQPETGDNLPGPSCSNLSNQGTLDTSKEELLLVLPESQPEVEMEICDHNTSQNENVTDNTDYDFFQTPGKNELTLFFEKHPQIPSSHVNVPFKIEKAFKRENQSNRKWLTYSFRKKALFCSVCLAFDERKQSSFNNSNGMTITIPMV